MSSSPNFVLKKQHKSQEGEDDEDMTPSDIAIDSKVSSFLHLPNDF